MKEDDKNGIGWISLHRRIKEHWIWKSDRRLKWWIDILLTVNHSDNMVLVRGKLVECKRGQSVKSLEGWAKDWRVSKGAVRDFFRLLQTDSMITSENLQNTTRITVCNYDYYQSQLHAQTTVGERSGNGQGTQTIMNNNVNNENKVVSERAKKFHDDVFQEKNKRMYGKDMLTAFLSYWGEKTPDGKRMKFELQKTWETSRRLAAWKSREPHAHKMSVNNSPRNDERYL